jgi:hypothetical protein
MKRLIPVVLLSTICATGCVTSWWGHRSEDKAVTREPLPPRTPPALVTPDQITPANAHAVSQALWDELDSVKSSPEEKTEGPHEQRKDQR